MDLSSKASIPVYYADESLVVVEKPPALLIHRTPLSRDTSFLIEQLRKQLSRFVYPVHRLDRATSGVMVFALTKESASKLCLQFRHNRIHKEYQAVVRGWIDDEISIDYPLLDREKEKRQDAITELSCLKRIELPFASDRHMSSRYSFVNAVPHTGRTHQIRRHCKHIFHPIIGDTTYGHGIHNRIFSTNLELSRLLLHSAKISFTHPDGEEKISCRSNISLFNLVETSLDLKNIKYRSEIVLEQH